MTLDEHLAEISRLAKRSEQSGRTGILRHAEAARAIIAKGYIRYQQDTLQDNPAAPRKVLVIPLDEEATT